MKDYAQFIVVFTVVVGVSVAILNLFFAIGVYIDADELDSRNGQEIALVPSYVWALATLFGGVFVATAYWVVNRSSLVPRTTNNQETDLSEIAE